MFRKVFLITISVLLSLVSQALLAQQTQAGRTALPEQINSSFIEIRPFITGDGQSLYFSRREHPDNMNGEKDMQDVYVVHRNQDGWGEPENLGRSINNKYANSLCSVSPDGQELLLINTYTRFEVPLVTFRKQGNRWGKLEPVVIQDYYNTNDYLDFFQSHREQVLLLAIQSRETLGQQDLHVSFPQEDGSWSKPLNLGPGINTKKSDFAPFIAADGITLFFSSYGLPGKGGADIFYSVRLDDTWQNWSIPVNLGAHINTPGEETYCSLTDDMQQIFYVSYRQGSVIRDIYQSPLEYDPNMPDAAAVVAKNTQHNAPDVVQKRIESVNSGSEIQASVTPETGIMYASINATTPYPEEITQSPPPAHPIIEEHAGHGAKDSRKMVTSATKTKDDLALSVIHRAIPSDIPQVKQYMVLKHVYFDFNQSVIKPEDYVGLLQELKQFVKQHPNAKLKVVGHADEMGSVGENLKISKLRAEAVKELLLKQQVAEENIIVTFKGEQAPLATNDDDREGRELNRRVEFYIMMPAAN